MTKNRRGAAAVGTAAVVAISLLLGAGAAYRFYAPRWQVSIDKPIELPVPLSKMPRQLGRWTGQELKIEETTAIYIKQTFADDYVSLRYMNPSAQYVADVYIVYCATRPASIVGHQPRVCYPGTGWIWDSTTPSKIVTRSGRTVECLIHNFHRPSPAYQQVYVLNFYILNGQTTLEEKNFSGWWGRRPNLNGDPAQYVAQVQISSFSEDSIKAMATDLVDTVLTFLPDKDGQVAATELYK